MQQELLDDAVVDGAEIAWTRDAGAFFTRATVDPAAGEGARPLRNFLTVASLEDAWLFAQGVAGRETRATEMAGYSFVTGDGEPLDEGVVRIFDGIGREAYLCEDAFHRLLARLYAVLIEGAERTADPATKEPWWPKFRALAGRMAKA